MQNPNKATLTASAREMLANSIINIPALNDAGVRFVESSGKDDFIVPACKPNVWVVIKVVEDSVNTNSANIYAKEKRDMELRASKVAESIASAAFSCASAVMTGIATGAAGAGAIPTGGATTPLAVIAWAGTVSNATMCGIAIGKVLNYSLDNDWFNAENNQILDESKAFKAVEMFLEGTNNVADLVSFGSAGKKLLEYSKYSGKSVMSVFKGELSRGERHEIAKNVFYKMHGGAKKAAKAEFKELVKAGKLANRISLKEIEKIKGPLMSGIESVLKKIAEAGTAKALGKLTVYILIED